MKQPRPSSQRNALDQPATEPEITIRKEAPDWLRTFLVDSAYEARQNPRAVPSYLCKILLEATDPGDWGDRYIDAEVRRLIAGAHWYYVYDFAEWIATQLPPSNYGDQPSQVTFANSLNAVSAKKAWAGR